MRMCARSCSLRRACADAADGVMLVCVRRGVCAHASPTGGLTRRSQCRRVCVGGEKKKKKQNTQSQTESTHKAQKRRESPTTVIMEKEDKRRSETRGAGEKASAKEEVRTER